MSKPQEIYAELLERAPFAAGLAFRAFPAPPGLVVRAFVDGLSRLPGISLQVSSVDVPSSFVMPRMKGANTTVHSDAVSRARRVEYTISASGPAHASVFVELASGMIAEISASMSASDALTAVAQRLKSWTLFFDARAEEGLGRSAQLGLIGELLCLQRLSLEVGLSSVLSGWAGPTGSLHDFQFLGGSIEVKLSTTSSPERFRITSERQLDESAVPILLLCGIVAQEQPAGAVGLADLVDVIRSTLLLDSPSDIGLFDRRLQEAGYCEQDRSRYLVRISVRSIEFVHVQAGFPRVVPSDLRSGVFGVSYEIPRSAILPFSIQPQILGELIRGIK